MTRKSKREIERALADLGDPPDETADVERFELTQRSREHLATLTGAPVEEMPTHCDPSGDHGVGERIEFDEATQKRVRTVIDPLTGGGEEYDQP